ncbi:hypothetical protein [Clostridium estertheticum]|uniref:Uncharacterized protein n=1 Tax=Clostridium estertheticum TaxID=238834 RepID=A0A7Y3WU17_9CLOT|nr:hypothetical protein [Clostridium estertheticum]NNU77565.1 hypothetical protein [Clostridium estertheticum]WBL48494.1 hypothetical protein LOR37_07505 [Clostridium estertheticum]
MVILTALGIILTLFIGIVNMIYSILNNKKTRFINTVTTSRITWISELRGYISEYISLIPLNGDIYMEKYSERNIFFQSFYRKKLLVELMLNKQDKFDKRILDTVTKIYNFVDEIYKCIDLMYIVKLPYYRELDPMGMEITLKKLIQGLDNNTAIIIKEKYIDLLGITENNDKDNVISMDARMMIYTCETKGIHRIFDAYRICIDKLIEELNHEIKNIVDVCQQLLKKEWDRVKVESEKGKCTGNKKKKLVYCITRQFLVIYCSGFIILIVAFLIILFH